MVTVVTLYRDGMAESFVGVVQGTIDEGQRKKMADELKLGQDDELYFCETEVMSSPDQLREFNNVSSSGLIGSW